MSFVTSKKMLDDAKKGGYAVGAFNVENLEMAKAVVEAASELNAPVMLQTTPSTLKYASVEEYVGIVKALAEKVSVPVCLHLDHGNSFELCSKALRAGYTSIMIDGSKLPLDENIAITKKVAEMCRAMNVTVEGEIGQVGGKEDDTVCENASYAIPSEAVEFEKQTGLTSMAVGVGTAHGFYATTPILNLDLITELNNLLTVPMVLHGASGLSAEAVKECVKRGMCKVNFATELRVAYTEGVKEVLANDPKVFDPKKYGTVAMAKVKELVKNRMEICGCIGKA